jgi:hypothetical protein
MLKQEALKPHDVVVALRLADSAEASYAALAVDLSMSASTAHESVERLQLAGLLRPDSRQVNRHFLLEFLEHGVRFAFPAQLLGRKRGIPTAHSGPALAREIISDEQIVWADSSGNAFGPSITPLCAKAEDLPMKCPVVYELLTLVDAIRIGRSRERSRAVEMLNERLAVAG